MTVEEYQAGRGYDYIPNLNREGANRIGNKVVEIAEDLRISGIVIIRNRFRMLQFSQTIGNPLKTSEVKAEAKLDTVLKNERSSSVQRKRIIDNGYRVEDYAGEIGSLFSGGVAILTDDERKLFLGAGGFSGSDQEIDEAILNEAIHRAGFTTDLKLISAKGIAAMLRKN